MYIFSQFINCCPLVVVFFHCGLRLRQFHDSTSASTATSSVTTSDIMATQRVDVEEVVTEPRETSAAGTDSNPAAAAAAVAAPVRDKPVCLIVLGMAGSGKTTFVQVRRLCRLTAANCVSLFGRCQQNDTKAFFGGKLTTSEWITLVNENFSCSTKHFQDHVVHVATNLRYFQVGRTGIEQNRCFRLKAKIHRLRLRHDHADD